MDNSQGFGFPIRWLSFCRLALAIAMIVFVPGCGEREAARIVEPPAPESKSEITPERQKTMNEASENDGWEEWWDARLAAMKPILGEPEDDVFHSPVPFYLGGAADVVAFRNHVDGWVYITSDLIGDDQQKKNNFGQYELMLCLREQDDWAPRLISNLARYSTQAVLNPIDTMEIGPALPDDSTIAAILFVEYATFEVNGVPAGLLLCLGITEDELEECKAGRARAVLQQLKDDGVFPFTDLNRRSVELPDP